jgi:hypothetical protein
LSNSSYGASTIKRIRRSGAQVAQLDAQIVDVLSGDHPQSVRHVYYRMTDPRLPEPVPKDRRRIPHGAESLLAAAAIWRCPV